MPNRLGHKQWVCTVIFMERIDLYTMLTEQPDNNRSISGYRGQTTSIRGEEQTHKGIEMPLVADHFLTCPRIEQNNFIVIQRACPAALANG